MATDDNFTGLVPGPADTSEQDLEPYSEPDLEPYSEQDSELDAKPYSEQDSEQDANPYSELNLKSRIKPVKTSKKDWVEIDDDLFRKVLFFTLFQPYHRNGRRFNFQNIDENINDIYFYDIYKYLYSYIRIEKDRDTIYNRYVEYLKIKGFIETITVFLKYLETINFYKYGYKTRGVVYILKYDRLNEKDFWFRLNIQPIKAIQPIEAIQPIVYFPIASLEINSNNNTQFGYDNIKLEKSVHVEGNKTYITQTEFNTLRNYVELLEKLIAEEIVIELKDGELFANDTKIGYKSDYKSGCIKSIGNAIGNTCKSIREMLPKAAATIGVKKNPNKVFYDTIFSIYTNPIINGRYNLDIHRVSDGGRNNKTRKRHRNKASHKKMRKSHNIRKRKTTGKKRK